MLKQKYFDKTAAFFDKHGSKALVIGRFVPFVRTFITVVAGRHPDGPRAGSSSGAWSAPMLWVVSITLLGYFLGSAVPRAWARTSTRRSWRSSRSR